jgi:hypothetical protein
MSNWIDLSSVGAQYYLSIDIEILIIVSYERLMSNKKEPFSLTLFSTFFPSGTFNYCKV